MKARTAHTKTRRYGAGFLAFFFAVSLFVGLFSAPHLAFAIERSDLTEANGWTCPNGRTNTSGFSCTKGTHTATCSAFDSGDGRLLWTCNDRDSAGSTNVTTTNSGSGTSITDGTDQNGQHVSEVDSPVAEVLAAPLEAGATFVLGTLLSPFAAMMWVAFKISSLLLGLAGLVFNWTVAVLVFEFAKYLGNSPGMLVAWGILRDFGNIGLLFGFVFTGISTILDLHSYPWKKALPNLVIFAVLLNFSLFAAEAVIDATNVLASTLYEQTNSGQQCRGTDWLGCVVNTGIAGQLLERVNIVSVYDGGIESTGSIEASWDGVANQFTHPLENILKFVGLALVTAIAAVVLFAGAFMLISRAVVLAFLMVTSPIGFAGMAIPGLTDMARKWWDKLINQALFAPVFILLLLVALKMTDGLNQLASANGLAGALSVTDAASTGSILLFLLIMGFMIGALLMAKQFSIAGASFAVNSASAFVFGTVARGTNYLGGGAANGLRRFQQRTGFGGRIGEVAVNRFIRPGENRNNDLRRMPGVSALLGAAGIKEGAKPAEHATFKDLNHIPMQLKNDQEARHTEYENEIKDAKLEKNAHGDGSKMQEDDKKHLASKSAKQLEEEHGIQAGEEGYWSNITSDQFEKLMGSEKLSDTEKERGANARFRRLGSTMEEIAEADRIGNRVLADKLRGELKATVRGMAKGDLERVPADALSRDDFLSALSEKQRDDLASSNKRSKSEQQMVRQSSPVIKFENTFNTPPAGVTREVHIKSMLDKLSAEQASKLDEKVLQDRDVARQLSKNVLNELQRSAKISSETFDIIATANPETRSGARAGYWH